MPSLLVVVLVVSLTRVRGHLRGKQSSLLPALASTSARSPTAAARSFHGRGRGWVA